jgi:alpha-tubulin suppressor-like RCC1 family protein
MTDGTVVCWGRNDFGQCVPPSHLENVIAINCSFHMFAMTADGKLVAWGDNHQGQCSVPEDISVMQQTILM